MYSIPFDSLYDFLIGLLIIVIVAAAAYGLRFSLAQRDVMGHRRKCEQWANKNGYRFVRMEDSDAELVWQAFRSRARWTGSAGYQTLFIVEDDRTRWRVCICDEEGDLQWESDGWREPWVFEKGR